MRYDSETKARLRKVFDDSWSWLELSYAGSQFANYLNRADLVNFKNGIFMVEVPDERIQALFNRHSEKLVIQHTLETLMPAEWNWIIGVEFVIGQGRQVAQGPDYLELEEAV